jgi:hypothetical protein
MMEATDLERTSAALNVEGLTKVYADATTALDELSLRVPAGTFIGLLGPLQQPGPPLQRCPLAAARDRLLVDPRLAASDEPRDLHQASAALDGHARLLPLDDASANLDHAVAGA